MSWLDTVFGPNTQTSTMTQQLTPGVQEAIRKLVSGSTTAYDQPYQAYTQPRVAPFTGDTQTGMHLARSIGGTSRALHENYFRPAVGALATTWPQVDQQAYMNPYINAVLDPAMADLRRETDMTRRNINATAAATGAFGGSRNALAQSELDRNFMQEAARLSANERARAYDAAHTAFRADQAAIPALWTNLLTQNAARLGTEVSPLLQIGGMQEDKSQRNLDLLYGDFLEQRNYPWAQAGQLSGILAGSPTQTASRTTVSDNIRPSPLGQVAGTAIGLGGLVGWNNLQSGLGWLGNQIGSGLSSIGSWLGFKEGGLVQAGY